MCEPASVGEGLHPSAKPLGVSGSWNRAEKNAPHPNPPPRGGREPKVCHPAFIAGSKNKIPEQVRDDGSICHPELV